MMSKATFRITMLMSLVVGVFGFSFNALAQSSNADIAVLLPDSKSSARWENDDRKYFEEAFKAAGVTYSIVNAEGDAQTQTTQAESAITNGAKVILLVNLDSGSGASIIADGRAAGVKMIDYDRLTIEGPGADFYVSFNNYAVGALQGQGLIDAVKAAQDAGTITGDVNVAILDGAPTDNNATLFSLGAHCGINDVGAANLDSTYDASKPLGDLSTECPTNGTLLDKLFNDPNSGWHLVAEQAVEGWDNQVALTDFTQMVTAHPEINAALAANDGLAQSVITERQNDGLDFIPVTGQDATVGGIQNVLAGRQSMTVYKAIKTEATAAADLAIALVKGEDTSMMATGSTNNGMNDIPSVLLTPVAVTKDNIADTVIADGFRTWAELCVGDFAQYCPADAMMMPEATATVTPSS
jgi:D-xylose transport system substrate-binding protein